MNTNTENTATTEPLGSQGSCLASPPPTPYPLSAPSAPPRDPNPLAPTPQSAMCNLKSPIPQIPRPRFIDTWDIPFPKNQAELDALDATREVPYLKALCNRRHIHTPGRRPTPEQIIPIVQQILDAHIPKLPRNLTKTCDIYLEWRLIRDDLTDFLKDLHSLLPTSVLSVSSVNSVSLPNPSSNPKHPQTLGHSNNSNQTDPKTPAIPTNQNQPQKTSGHSNISPQKNSPAPQSPTDPLPSVPCLPFVLSVLSDLFLPPICNLQSEICNSPQGPPHPRAPHPRPKTTMHPPLRTTQRQGRRPHCLRTTQPPHHHRHSLPPLLHLANRRRQRHSRRPRSRPQRHPRNPHRKTTPTPPPRTRFTSQHGPHRTPRHHPKLRAPPIRQTQRTPRPTRRSQRSPPRPRLRIRQTLQPRAIR
jgi:hypothetical protein